MKANDTRTKIIITINVSCYLFDVLCIRAEILRIESTALYVRTILGFFVLLLKIPRNFIFLIYLLGHHVMPPLPQKRNAYPILESQWKTNHFHIVCNWIFRCLISYFSVGIALVDFCSSLLLLLLFSSCCLFVCVWQKCQSLFDWSNLHTVQRKYTVQLGYFIHQTAANFFSFFLDFQFVDLNISTFPIHITNFSNSTNIGITNKLR